MNPADPNLQPIQIEDPPKVTARPETWKDYIKETSTATLANNYRAYLKDQSLTSAPPKTLISITQSCSDFPYCSYCQDKC